MGHTHDPSQKRKLTKKPSTFRHQEVNSAICRRHGARACEQRAPAGSLNILGARHPISWSNMQIVKSDEATLAMEPGVLHNEGPPLLPTPAQRGRAPHTRTRTRSLRGLRLFLSATLAPARIMALHPQQSQPRAASAHGTKLTRTSVHKSSSAHSLSISVSAASSSSPSPSGAMSGR